VQSVKLDVLDFLDLATKQPLMRHDELGSATRKDENLRSNGHAGGDGLQPPSITLLPQRERSAGRPKPRSGSNPSCR